jgi:methylase of polypeptide subunit release factors
MIFDEAYFKNIWGTAHRHDYCDNVANLLIKKFGVGRYLDIGTGCGFLVKTLREKGCEAFGLEISEYAINNSHGNVIQGTVLDIPFEE